MAPSFTRLHLIEREKNINKIIMVKTINKSSTITFHGANTCAPFRERKKPTKITTTGLLWHKASLVTYHSYVYKCTTHSVAMVFILWLCVWMQFSWSQLTHRCVDTKWFAIVAIVAVDTITYSSCLYQAVFHRAHMILFQRDKKEVNKHTLDFFSLRVDPLSNCTIALCVDKSERFFSSSFGVFFNFLFFCIAFVVTLTSTCTNWFTVRNIHYAIYFNLYFFSRTHTHIYVFNECDFCSLVVLQYCMPLPSPPSAWFHDLIIIVELWSDRVPVSRNGLQLTNLTTIQYISKREKNNHIYTNKRSLLFVLVVLALHFLDILFLIEMSHMSSVCVCAHRFKNESTVNRLFWLKIFDRCILYGHYTIRWNVKYFILQTIITHMYIDWYLKYFIFLIANSGQINQHLWIYIYF